MQSNAIQPVVDMDIAKNVFQLHLVDTETGEIQLRKLKREKVTTFFSNRQKSLIAMEACGGAHHWARLLLSLWHEVKLLPANHVKPFVLPVNSDARNAQAIWVAAQQLRIKPVSVKSEQHRACLALHRLRAQLMKMRIMQINGLRSLLYEFGIVLPEGHHLLLQRIQGELASVQEQGRLPTVLVESVQDQLRGIDGLQHDIHQLDRRLAAKVRQDQHMQALQAIPGIGPLTAPPLVSTSTDLNSFASGRQFAAWLGLTSGRTGTGGKTRQLGISKRGDPHVRTMLMHGARAVITRVQRSGRIERLLQRRPYSVSVAALAIKLTRSENPSETVSA